MSRIAGSRASKELEEALWFIPIEDRRQLDSQREGMLSGFKLDIYLILVEYTGCFLSTSRERLREVAKKLGVHHLANLDACPA